MIPEDSVAKRNPIKEKTVMQIGRDFHCEVRCQPLLADYTSIGLGGVAPFMIFPKEEENLEGLLNELAGEKLPWRILGRGTNLIIRDEGIEEIVISLTELPTAPKFSGNTILVAAGYSLTRLVRGAAAKGLSGLEFAIGIPGSVGGAVKLNASSFGGSMEEVISEVTLFSPGKGVIKQRESEMGFAYRSTFLREEEVILSAMITLKPSSSWKIKKEISHLQKLRRERQPVGEKTAGCIFKNPFGVSAGQLIDSLGLKALAFGGAVVSEKHANFIINRREATAAEVLALIDLIKERVYKTLGVELQEEVVIW